MLFIKRKEQKSENKCDGNKISFHNSLLLKYVLIDKEKSCFYIRLTFLGIQLLI